MSLTILEGSESRRLLALGLNAITLIAIYAAYGVLQERIMKGTYKSAGEEQTFTSAPLLVLCNRVVSLLTGLILVQIPRAEGELPPGLQLKNTQKASRLARLRPNWPLAFYALVAGLNNIATFSQYASLSYLSFATATLGKSAKMVPALILGYSVFGKKYKAREWFGVAVVITGVYGYINSLNQGDSKASNWMGVFCLVAYLFFDGLTSTTQEHLFGKGKNAKEQDEGRVKIPSVLGISSGVMDQMVWVNLFSAMIAFLMLFINPSGSAGASITLARNSSILQLHILMLSATAAAGLLVLFHVIATYGALIAGLIMTLRQFVSVICNAVWFSNVSNIPISGWSAIGLVASGVWIKMDRRYDEALREGEKHVEAEPVKKPFLWVRQYLFPLFSGPVGFMIFIGVFTHLISPTSQVLFTGIHSSESGNLWDDSLIDMFKPACPPGPLNSAQYNTTIRTAIATYPRSGSSYTRTLIERSTGYFTSSLYCDKPFDDFFLHECKGQQSPWLVKTHFPSELKHGGRNGGDRDLHFRKFDRYIEVIRNPIDVIWSLRNLLLTEDHSARVKNLMFTPENQYLLKPHLDDWNQFLYYWDQAPIQGLVIRYEDIRKNPVTSIMRMASFLLPPKDLPSLSRVACALRLDHDKEMYPSSKVSPFENWEQHFHPETFDWIIETVKSNWCKHGYDQLLFEATGKRGPVICHLISQSRRIGVEHYIVDKVNKTAWT